MIRYAGIFICLFWCHTVWCQQTLPVLQWQKPVGGILEDFGEDILLTPDGGFLVLGGARSNDFDGNIPHHNAGFNVSLFKYDADRVRTWGKEYGGDGNDYGISIKPVDGGYIILAATNSNNADVSGLHAPNIAMPDIWIFKIDNNGNLLWQKCLGGSGTELPGSVDITPSGGYIISGYTNSNDGDVNGNHGGNGDIWLVELNATGDILWQKCYGGTGEDGGGISRTVRSDGPLDGSVVFLFPFNQVKSLPGGGYLLTGLTKSNDGDISGNHGNGDSWMARLNPAGNIIWQTCHGGNELDMPCGLLLLNDGYIVGGTSSSTNAPFTNFGGSDGWLFKTDWNGNIVWQFNYGGSNDDICYDLIRAKDGGYYMVGGVRSENTCQILGLQDFWTIKISSEGTWLWEKYQGGSENEFATGIAEAPDGSLLYLTGWERSNDRDIIGHHSAQNLEFITNDNWIIIYGFAGAAEAPQVTITASVEKICAGKPVEFKATSLHSGTDPRYSWYINDVEIMQFGPTYTSSTLQDGDRVICKLLTQIPCIVDQEVSSNEITIRWFPDGKPAGFLPLEWTKCVNLYEELKPTMSFEKYVWSTGATTPSIRIVSPGLYWLEVTDITGCTGRDNVWVTTKSCMNAVYIPSAFTPNNDGKNDVFKPLVDGKLLRYSFSIYDRWGQLVLQTNDPSKGWDGTLKGAPYNAGVFVWMCTYQLAGEEVRTEKGTVTLLR